MIEAMKWHKNTLEVIMTGSLMMVAQGVIILLKSSSATLWHWVYLIFQQIVLGAALGFLIALVASLPLWRRGKSL